jgi:hypothetical protein
MRNGFSLPPPKIPDRERTLVYQLNYKDGRETSCGLYMPITATYTIRWKFSAARCQSQLIERSRQSVEFRQQSFIAGLYQQGPCSSIGISCFGRHLGDACELFIFLRRAPIEAPHCGRVEALFAATVQVTLHFRSLSGRQQSAHKIDPIGR